MSGWQQDARYGASSLIDGGTHTELWFGPVDAMLNGSYISLHFKHPADEHPRTLLLPARDVVGLVEAKHCEHRFLRGETYRTAMRDGTYLDARTGGSAAPEMDTI